MVAASGLYGKHCTYVHEFSLKRVAIKWYLRKRILAPTYLKVSHHVNLFLLDLTKIFHEDVEIIRQKFVIIAKKFELRELFVNASNVIASY